MAELDFLINGTAGHVSTATFENAIRYSIGLLREFDSAITGKSRGTLRWYISKLRSDGDLLIGFASKVKLTKKKQRELLTDYSPNVTGSFMYGLDSLENRAVTPPYLSEIGLQRAQGLSGLIGKNGAQGFRFTTKEAQVDVTSKTAANVNRLLPIRRNAIGSVEGKLEAISLHGEARFIVYQSITKKAVTCVFNKDLLLNTIKESLGKRVIVSGDLSKNVAGDTLRIQVKRVRVIGDGSIAEVAPGLPQPYFADFSTEDYLREIRG